MTIEKKDPRLRPIPGCDGPRVLSATPAQVRREAIIADIAMRLEARGCGRQFACECAEREFDQDQGKG